MLRGAAGRAVPTPTTPPPRRPPQVIDFYKSKVVTIAADKPQKEVAAQIHKTLE